MLRLEKVDFFRLVAVSLASLVILREVNSRKVLSWEAFLDSISV